eukprot:84745-Amorphochlora_amoeboformis.AAC.1
MLRLTTAAVITIIAIPAVIVLQACHDQRNFLVNTNIWVDLMDVTSSAAYANPRNLVASNKSDMEVLTTKLNASVAPVFI